MIEQVASPVLDLVHELPLYDEAGHVRVVVETPRGSGIKLKYEPRLGVFTWSRPLSLGVTFPHDFGFVPQTLAGDGDAVDAVLLTDVGSYPGVVATARAVGALRVEQQRAGQPTKRNDRLLMVPVNAHRSRQLDDIAGVPPRVLDELEAFFSASLALTGKNVRFCGWADAAEATQLIADAHRRYRKERGP